MKQKRTRDLFEKPANGLVGNAPAQRENAFCPKALPENDPKERAERLTVGSHLSGSNVQTGAEFAGAREPRWSPAAIHGEAERSEGTSVFRASFRVGW